jgi:hypothetical protein
MLLILIAGSSKIVVDSFFELVYSKWQSLNFYGEPSLSLLQAISTLCDLVCELWIFPIHLILLKVVFVTKKTYST